MKQVKRSIKLLAAGVMSLLLLVQAICPTAFAASEELFRQSRRGDEMILLTQRWLNQEYGKVPGFGFVEEDGLTGWDTIHGLLRALQHELGITTLSNHFGPQTEERYGKHPLQRKDGAKDRKFALLQGALWCKGYAPGYHLREKNGKVVFDAVFDAGVEKAVKALKQDMGYARADGVVTTNVMKALLSMDSYQLLPSAGGDAKIRAMQQKLNREYGDYIGIIPCDGLYNRDTNIAMIYALQAEEGLPVDVANGYFGEMTKRCCPELPYVQNETAARRYPGTEDSRFYTAEQITSVTAILQFCLYANGFGDGVTDGVFDGGTRQALKQFQKAYALPITERADKSTWMSLLSSAGDPDRPAKAADCAAILDTAKAKTLYDEGYRYIGRYLTGTLAGGVSKAITRKEAQIIFDAGLRFFPIYQTEAYYNEYFTSAQGTEDARDAVKAATRLGVPAGTTIYFAVDYDCVDAQITSHVLPYFKALHQEMKDGPYEIGIYGSRNVCTRVSQAGYAVSSFVGDMSTGFSGNLGYRLPDNWAFDQFANVEIGSGAGGLEIDKDGFSGRDEGVSYLDLGAPEVRLTNRSSTGKPYLTWKAVDGADSYEVYRRTGKNGTFTRLLKTTGTRMTNTSAKPGETYYYKVRAVAGEQKGYFSQILHRMCDCAQPVVNLSLRSDGKPVLRWDKVNGAVKYEVYCAEGKGDMTRLTTLSGTKLTHSSAKSGQDYTYQVRALCRHTSGNSARSAEVRIRCGGTAALKVPTLHLTLKQSTGKPYLTWNTVDGAEKYEIYYRAGKSGSYHRLCSTAGTRLTHSSAQPGTTYYYKVRAVAGSTKGAFSSSHYKTCDCARPVVKLSVRSDGKPVLQWDKVDGAVKYEVSRATRADGSFTRLTKVSGTRLTNSSVTKGHTYYYKVRALCEPTSGNSAWSEVVHCKIR